MPKATPLIKRHGWISSQNTVFCEGRYSHFCLSTSLDKLRQVLYIKYIINLVKFQEVEEDFVGKISIRRIEFR